MWFLGDLVELFARIWSADDRPEARWFAVGCLAVVVVGILIVVWVYAG